MGPSTAVAVGDLGSVVKTTDGGATWSVCPPIPGPTGLWAVSYVGPSTLVGVSGGGVILRSTDGGITWSPQVSGTTESLLSVDFDGASNGNRGRPDPVRSCGRSMAA